MIKPQNELINKWMIRIPLEDVQTQSGKSYSHPQECLLCGKIIKTPKYWVHLTTDCDLISTDQDIEDSQGFHLIGNECRKRLPNNFIFVDTEV